MCATPPSKHMSTCPGKKREGGAHELGLHYLLKEESQRLLGVRLRVSLNKPAPSQYWPKVKDTAELLDFKYPSTASAGL